MAIDGAALMSALSQSMAAAGVVLAAGPVNAAALNDSHPTT
jgi:hypothetical protein